MSGERGAISAQSRLSETSLYEQMETAVAIRRLDVEKMRRTCIVLNIGSNLSDDTILAICHHARLKLLTATPEEKSASEQWLRFRNLI